MQINDLVRRFLLDVDAAGFVFVRERGSVSTRGALPVFSTETRDEAEALRVRHCRLANDGSGLYCLNDPPRSVDDLPRVSDLFRSSHARKAA